ncbi:MAG: hypothetical protein ABR592_06390 [Nitriliruptorales bacterium]
MSPPTDLELVVSKACWRAVTTLAVDRAAARAQLQACFRSGKMPEALDGRTSGHFLTTTLGWVMDPLFAPLARVWMPWRGKIFDAGGASGWNWFSDSARGLLRLLFPRYEGMTDDRPGTFLALRFRTDARPSELLANVPVLRIDYDLAENPSWPIRRIADELVQIGDDMYLGQALVRRGNAWLRVGWFALEGKRASEHGSDNA